MDKSGTVIIRVSSENDVVLIAVTDYGGGLDPALQTVFLNLLSLPKTVAAV